MDILHFNGYTWSVFRNEPNSRCVERVSVASFILFVSCLLSFLCDFYFESVVVSVVFVVVDWNMHDFFVLLCNSHE